MQYYVVRQSQPPCTKHWPLMLQSNDKGALLFHIACFFLFFLSAEITTQAPNKSLSQTKAKQCEFCQNWFKIINPFQGPLYLSTHLRSWILMSLSFALDFLYDLGSSLHRGRSSHTSVFQQTDAPISQESPTSSAMLQFRVRALCRLKNTSATWNKSTSENAEPRLVEDWLQRPARIINHLRTQLTRLRSHLFCQRFTSPKSTRSS